VSASFFSDSEAGIGLEDGVLISSAMEFTAVFRLNFPLVVLDSGFSAILSAGHSNVKPGVTPSSLDVVSALGTTSKLTFDTCDCIFQK